MQVERLSREPGEREMLQAAARGTFSSSLQRLVQQIAATHEWYHLLKADSHKVGRRLLPLSSSSSAAVRIVIGLLEQRRCEPGAQMLGRVAQNALSLSADELAVVRGASDAVIWHLAQL